MASLPPRSTAPRALDHPGGDAHPQRASVSPPRGLRPLISQGGEAVVNCTRGNNRVFSQGNGELVTAAQLGLPSRAGMLPGCWGHLLSPTPGGGRNPPGLKGLQQAGTRMGFLPG